MTMPDQSKYRTFWGNWKPRRKPHFFLSRAGWCVLQSVPGKPHVAKQAFGNTPQAAMEVLESLQ